MVADDAQRRWDTRHSTQMEFPEPSPFLMSVQPQLPSSGRALDVAGGTGRNAVWLASQGLDVTLVDISPVGVEVARQEASRRGLTLELVETDLERGVLPEGPWDVIVCVHYLQRSLFPQFVETLAEGGLLVCEMATVRNLERNERPPREFLLDEGELKELVGELEVSSYTEGWTDHSIMLGSEYRYGKDRHEARVLARKRSL